MGPRGAGGPLREVETRDRPPSFSLPFFAPGALGGDFPADTGDSWLLDARGGSAGALSGED